MRNIKRWMLSGGGYLEYSVRDVSKKGIEGTGAKVLVYQNDVLMESFEISKNSSSGSIWRVFRISKEGIIPINKVFWSY